MKTKLLKMVMSLTSCAAMFGTVVIVNQFCPFAAYQEKEPESVRKLRKF